MSKTKEFTRQELYDLVWSTPIVKLAREFGLSDVGLRKTCVRHEVPLGYWAKLNFGKPVKKTPLSPPDPSVSEQPGKALGACQALGASARQLSANL